MKKKISKVKLVVLVIILLILIISYISLVIYNYHSLQRYDNEILPNIYLEEFDMSHYTFEKSKIKIDFYSDYLLSRKIKLIINSKEYEYSLKDLGVVVDQDRTIKQIKDYQKKLSFSRKLMMVHGSNHEVFPFYYQVQENVLKETLGVIKTQVDVAAVDGFFDTSAGVFYNPGVPGYSFDIDKSAIEISKVFEEALPQTIVISLNGEVTNANGNEEYAKIDTLTSSFVTDFMPNTYLRNINLNTALGYINGTILAPGEVFSYCDKAGPFNKAGYVFYYEFVGNGVCQIATTTYNAALLGGLEIVKRYPHAKKSLYVAGGLDATVASYSSGWCVDMQFKNTYQYPIYIKAYSDNGQAHVEFWSNHDAKGGLEYTTSSKKIGVRGYKSYLHTWKDGAEIDVHEIATTWYTEE